MISSNKHQMRTGAACGQHATGGVTRRFTPAAHQAQGGRHVPSVGAASDSSSLFDAPRKVAERTSLIRAQLSRAFGLGSFSQFSLRFNGGSSHLRVPQHLDCQVMYVPERHSSSPFVVRRLDDDEHMKGHREPCSRNQRKRLPQ